MEKKIIDPNKNNLFWKDFVNLPENPYKLDRSISGLECLFVYPSKLGDFSRRDYPLPLGYMASLVRMNKGKAKIIIQDVEKYFPETFKNKDLICFYPMIGLFDKTLKFAERVKKDNPLSKICFFNSDQHQHEMILCTPNAKNFALAMMKRHPYIDYTLIGEAESSLVKLCGKLATNEENFEDVPSCAYRVGSEVKFSSKPIEPVDFKFLPFASRDNLEMTLSKEGINTHSPRIQSSRGCLSSCSYCAESRSNITIGGRKKSVLTREISTFVDEIDLLQKNYGIVFFNVIDSSFEDSGKQGIKKMEEFCDEILNRNIKASFKIHLRAETTSKLSEDFLYRLKDTGVDIIGIGLESGINRELNSYKKIASIEESITSIHKLEDSGMFFAVVGHMMFGPVLKLEDLLKKIEFLKTIHRGWDYLDISDNILIFPGTAYHNYIKSKGLEIKCDELSTTVPYRFEDERIREVSEEMGKLKIKCPETVKLNNLLYDAMNIKSRYFNRMNRHLWANESSFKEFKSKINDITYEVEDAYISYFKELIDLSESGYSERKADLLFEKNIPHFFPEVLKKVNSHVVNFLGSCENKGLSTNRLYLKTWLSVINTQINTAGGKNG